MARTEEILDPVWDWGSERIGEFIGICRAITSNSQVGVSFHHGPEFQELAEVFRYLEPDDKQYVLAKLEKRYRELKKE